MLLLLFKNAMWAAWWPYYTMLLAMEKAATQAAANRAKSPPPPPQAKPAPPPRSAPHPQPVPQIGDRGVARDAASSAAVTGAFMAAEVPPPLGEMMKLSIEQAKQAFEAFVAASERAWTSLETGSPSGRAGLFALNAKIVEIARLNAEANFALAAKLAEAKDVAQAIELQSRHVAQQMDIFMHQLEEMRDLATQIIQQANPTTWIDAGVRSASGPSSGLSSSSYAPSSSFTPGETGRTY
jgi:hypothetical protein